VTTSPSKLTGIQSPEPAPLQGKTLSSDGAFSATRR
jgi:hypothetical protein